MKINIGNPTTGCNKAYNFNDDIKLRPFMEQRIASEVDISSLGEDFAGYIVKITGGIDKDGFPMMQGVLSNKRHKVLLTGKNGCFIPKKNGERKRKNVRGCIVANDISCLNCIVVKKGKKEIPGLTDTVVPRKLGPKRASNIRKLFDLEKDDDVKKFVLRAKVMRKDGKPRGTKSPKIQRLVTPERIARKARLLKIKKQRWIKAKAAAVEYNNMLKKVKADKKEEANKVKVARRMEAQEKFLKSVKKIQEAKKHAKELQHQKLKKAKKLKIIDARQKAKIAVAKELEERKKKLQQKQPEKKVAKKEPAKPKPEAKVAPKTVSKQAKPETKAQPVKKVADAKSASKSVPKKNNL